MNTHTKIIIAIDGPAASGKGTLSRNIAAAMNFAHMDTGALYRAVALEVMNDGGQADAESDAVRGAERLMARLDAAATPGEVLDNPDLRTDETGKAASQVAAIQGVRDVLLAIQQNFANAPGARFDGAVLDGRDIGTVICPGADVKLYVTASDEVRAERRLKELQSKGIQVTKAAVLADMRERDARDKSRSTAPLKAADDAVTLDTSDLTESEVLKQALDIIQNRLGLVNVSNMPGTCS